MRILAAFCLLASTALLACPAQARMWIISRDGSRDAPTIQAGIDSAAVGDSVILEGGTWHVHDINMKSGILLSGITGILETPNPEYTVIDADGQGRCVNCIDLTAASAIKALTFRDGIAPLVPAYNIQAGGAMYVSNSPLTITNCAFVNNHSDAFSGAIFSDYSTISLENCSFEHNSAGVGGGALGIDGDIDNATVMNCTFLENSATWRGGAVSAHSVTLTGCLFIRNKAEEYGADVSCDYATITNCTFVSAGNFQIAIWGGRLSLSKTIFANCGIRGTAYECAVSATCCDFYPNSGFANCEDWRSPDCFSLDPQFCDAGADNYALEQSSPCAPGNAPGGYNCGLIGARPVGCQSTAVEATTWGRLKAMFR